MSVEGNITSLPEACSSKYSIEESQSKLLTEI